MSEVQEGGSVTPYYQDEAVTLWLGDCREIMPMLATVDHVVTDPPYANLFINSTKKGVVNTAARGRTDSERSAGALINASRRELGYQGITPEDRAVIAGEIARVVERWAIVFCDAESLSGWRTDLEAGGLEHIRSGAWVSPACTPQFTGDRPGTGWEACEIAHRAGRKRWNGGGRPAVWVVNRPVNGGAERADANHPTPKPAALMEQIVSDFSDPGDVILDPFAGSGSLGVAAKRLGRQAILIEQREDYAANIARRLSQAALDLFPASTARAKSADLFAEER